MMAKRMSLKSIKRIVREEVGRTIDAEKKSMDRQLGRSFAKIKTSMSDKVIKKFMDMAARANLK